MNMIPGRLGGEPARPVPAVNGALPESDNHVGASTIGTEHVRAAGAEAVLDAQDAEAAERRAEIRDLARRVIAGAVLTLPVLYAVRAHEVFGLRVPAVLLNHWVQAALITPVMFYTGWPIHRTGWLPLSHPSARMHSLISLRPIAPYPY